MYHERSVYGYRLIGEGAPGYNAVQMENPLDRISIDPNVCFGKPCIRGTRIWVSLILDMLAAGESVEAILGDYPQLAREDVLAAIAYGAEAARERFIPVPTEKHG